MPTAFLLGFSRSVVGQLVASGELTLAGGAVEDDVAGFVAEDLGGRELGSSLISSLTSALVACPAVDELFADDERLREVVNDVPPSVLPR